MAQIYIDFTVRSKVCNIDLSNLLHLSRHSGHEINDTSRTGIKLDYSEWSFCTPIYHEIDINNVVKKFAELIMPHFERLKNELKESQAEVSICFVIRKENDDVSLALSSEMVKFCAELNASLDYDGIE